MIATFQHLTTGGWHVILQGKDYYLVVSWYFGRRHYFRLASYLDLYAQKVNILLFAITKVPSDGCFRPR